MPHTYFGMTTFNSDQHPRITDGTFTDKEQTAPELALSILEDDEPTTKVDRARDYAEQMRNSDPRVSREATTALVAEVERTVRNMRRKTGLSEDQARDAVGDTILDLTARIKNGHSIKGGLVQTAAAAVCSRYVNGPVRHETAKALKLLKEEVSKQEAAAGHHLTSADIARIAGQIRVSDKFHARHRPVEDFHLIEGFVRPTSFSQFPDSYIDEKMHEFGYGAGVGFDGIGSATDKLAEELENREATKADAMKRLWDVIASDQDVPTATTNRLSRRDATNVQRYMSELPGGVLKAARDHEDGLDNRNTMALFAPFANLSATDKDAVATMLLNRATHAQNLWTSAMYSATKSKETEQAEKQNLVTA